MTFLKQIVNSTRRDKIWNSTVRNKLKIIPIEEKIEKRQLGGLGHVIWTCKKICTVRTK